MNGVFTMNTRSLKLKIFSLQALYWMLFCSLYSFASVFLLSYQLSSTVIGLLLALTAVAVVFLQPLTGQLLKKSQFPLKKALLIASFLLALTLLGGLFFQKRLPLQLSLFILALLILLTLQPLINNYIFIWINGDINLWKIIT